MSKSQNAISPSREEDYPLWYQEVVKAAELAESSPARGCMVIKPWGYGIWENIQRDLDRRIKETGHENAYFPLFVPLSLLEKEAAHVEGFAKECAVVTHHRLEEKDGKLIPAGELDEPLIVRPTSEAVIGEVYAKWVKSYRDLPLLINQWANVVRWEMRPRLFLRTAEFLWQEGHTVHANEEEARCEVMTMLEVYRSFAEEMLALPTIVGEKPASERFPGAVDTYSIEAMMQDRKALQAGTSHYLGENFSRASNIRFLDEQGDLRFAHTTSWGVSTRLIGALVMAHSDDDGLRLPPRVAPKQAVILPITPKSGDEGPILEFAAKLQKSLSGISYAGRPLCVALDKRDLRGGEKNWQWIKKGIPLRIEIGAREVESNCVCVYRRDADRKERIVMNPEELIGSITTILDQIQDNYLQQATLFLAENTETGIKTASDFCRFFTPVNAQKPEIHGGFVRAFWCEDADTEALLKDLKVTVRCIPLEQGEGSGTCVLSGRPARREAIFAKAY